MKLLALFALAISATSFGGGFSSQELYSGPQGSVEISRVDETLNVEIGTWGGTSHSTCDFSGIAVKKTPTIWVAAKFSNEWDDGETDSTPFCVVTITFKDENTIAVSENGNCRSFCGHSASLVIDKATRQSVK